jgi:hypothetical protein
VPDRFGEPAADFDRGDLGAAFSAVAAAHPLDDGLVVGWRPAVWAASTSAQRR